MKNNKKVTEESKHSDIENSEQSDEANSRRDGDHQNLYEEKQFDQESESSDQDQMSTKNFNPRERRTVNQDGAEPSVESETSASDYNKNSSEGDFENKHADKKSKLGKKEKNEDELEDSES